MKAKNLTTLSLIGLSLVSIHTFADVKGPYIGAGVGLSTHFNDDDFSNGAAKLDTSGTAYSIYGGYYFNRIVGIELAHTQYGDVNVNEQANHINQHLLSPTSTSLSANLGYTFDNGLRPFALIGVSSLDLDQKHITMAQQKVFKDDTATAAHLGLGIEYTPPSVQHLTLRASYQGDYFDNKTNPYFVGSDDKTMSAEVFYLGAAYKF